MIELPETLRAPRIDEVPMNTSVKERLEKLESANIVEGYKLLSNDENEEQKKIPFNFYVEINIDNSRLWDLIINLSEELPDAASLIFGHIDTEPFYGEYQNRKDLLKELKDYKNELIKDTFIEWGIIYNDENKLIEIFISESKYVKFWGVNKSSFQQIMSKLNLQEIKNIEFVDEYPKVREPLTLFEKTALSSEKLINILIKKYTKK